MGYTSSVKLKFGLVVFFRSDTSHKKEKPKRFQRSRPAIPEGILWCHTALPTLVVADQLGQFRQVPGVRWLGRRDAPPLPPVRKQGSEQAAFGMASSLLCLASQITAAPAHVFVRIMEMFRFRTDVAGIAGCSQERAHARQEARPDKRFARSQELQRRGLECRTCEDHGFKDWNPDLDLNTKGPVQRFWLLTGMRRSSSKSW